MLQKVYAGDVVVPERGAMAFSDLMVESLFAEVWTREALSIRERRLILLGAIGALGEKDTFAIQARAALKNGELGNGAKLKLCINLITYIQWAAAFESFQLAKGIGLSQEVLEEAGQSNGQLTPMMLQYLATHKAPPEARESEAFQALMRNHMHIAEKDLAWALALARKAEVALPVGGLVAQSMARLYGVKDENRR